MASSQVSSKRHSVTFTDPPRSRQAKTIATSRNLRSSPEEKSIAAAILPCRWAISTKSLKYRPAHVTRSTIADARYKAAISSTFLHLLEGNIPSKQASISCARKISSKQAWASCVRTDILLSNTTPDQDVTIDQSSDPLYAYNTIRDQDIMYRK